MCDSWDERNPGPNSKWVCKACTYENWPRAARCAICSSPKNYNLFLETHRPHDIYEIASLVQDKSSSGPLYNNPKNKWSCISCTYLNWPKAVKCTQCQRRRSPSPPLPTAGGQLSPTVRPDASYSLMPSYNITDSIGGAIPKKPQRSGSPPSCVANGTPLTQSQKDLFQPVTGDKWTCFTCTYDNWPRSNRCIMCCSSKPTTTTTTTTNTTTSNTTTPNGTAGATTRLQSPTPLSSRLMDSMKSMTLDEASGRPEASGGVRSGFYSDSDGEEENHRTDSYIKKHMQ